MSVGRPIPRPTPRVILSDCEKPPLFGVEAAVEVGTAAGVGLTETNWLKFRPILG